MLFSIGDKRAIADSYSELSMDQKPVPRLLLNIFPHCLHPYRRSYQENHIQRLLYIFQSIRYILTARKPLFDSKNSLTRRLAPLQIFVDKRLSVREVSQQGRGGRGRGGGDSDGGRGSGERSGGRGGGGGGGESAMEAYREVTATACSRSYSLHNTVHSTAIFTPKVCPLQFTLVLSYLVEDPSHSQSYFLINPVLVSSIPFPSISFSHNAFIKHKHFKAKAIQTLRDRLLEQLLPSKTLRASTNI